MSSKTFVPAFHATVGDWSYYLCLMSYAQVAREVNFAYELGVNKDLGTMIQRGIGDRTEDITKYLLENEHRFLGALIVAAWGGAPDYQPLRMADSDENVLEGIDRQFGVLTFDGTHQFFALDGQHRLRAIKDAVKKKPELGSEDISVIVVPHFDSEQGRRRTRRLFTNINRNAVKTNAQENIALDEDDGFAILTRRLLDDDSFAGQDDAVQVFGKTDEDGKLTLATRQVAAGKPAWTTIGILYDIAKELGWELAPSMVAGSPRATDDVLDASYEIVADRLHGLLTACGDLATKYSPAVGKELRAPKGHEQDGHPFMRPIVQLAVARAARHIATRHLLTWDVTLERLHALDWRMDAAPFNAVWQATPDAKSTKGKMISGKENQELLRDFLMVHLAPESKAQINRALSSYRSLKGVKYPVDVTVLGAHLVSAPAASSGDVVGDEPSQATETVVEAEPTD